MKKFIIKSVVFLILVSLFGCSEKTKTTEKINLDKSLEENNLDKALKIVATISGCKVRKYNTFDFGREKDSQNYSFIVDYEKSLDVVAKARDKLDSDILVFLGTTRWLGEEKHEGDEVVIARSNDQFDCLRIARTDGINYGFDTEDIIKELKKYDQEFGIEIFHATTDTVGFTLNAWPKDLKKFAKDLYKLCPDIIDQGALTLEKLELQIKANGQVTLWWD